MILGWAAPLVMCGSPKQIPPKALVGLWQVRTAEVASGFTDIYRFYSDGSFKFGFNQFTEPKRFLELHGHYVLKGHAITFQITERTDWVGGEIVRGGPEADGEWVVEGGKAVTIKQSGKQSDPVEIAYLPGSGNKPACLVIDGRKYFQVSDDPRSQE